MFWWFKQTHEEIVLVLLCDSVLPLENDHEIAIWGKETLFISLWKNWLNTNEQSIPLINYIIIQHILNVLWAVLKSEKGCPRMSKEVLRTRNQYVQNGSEFPREATGPWFWAGERLGPDVIAPWLGTDELTPVAFWTPSLRVFMGSTCILPRFPLFPFLISFLEKKINPHICKGLEKHVLVMKLHFHSNSLQVKYTLAKMILRSMIIC